MTDDWVPDESSDWVEEAPAPAPPLAQLQPGNFQPIGDAPPDFGEAKVQPGEVDNGLATAAKGLGSMWADMQATEGSQALSMLAAPIQQVAGGLAGAGKAELDVLTGRAGSALDDFVGTSQKVQDALQGPQYTPQTKGGEFVEKALALPQTAGKAVGEAAQDAGLPPSVAAAADVLTQFAPFMLTGEEGPRARVNPHEANLGHSIDADLSGHAQGDIKDRSTETESPGKAAANLERLKELDQKRGILTPEETAEHNELQYLDRRQGKVLGSGEPIEGVGNASALRENHDVENTPQIHTDIDNFKETNDTIGHPAGDVLIKHVGESLAKEFPPDENGTPQVYHHGGDEFTIVPRDGETLADVTKRVQDVREQVRNTPIELTDTKGVSTVHPGVDFSVGAGENHASAYDSITRDKAAREASGIRRPRNNRSTDIPGTEQRAQDSQSANPERPPEQVGDTSVTTPRVQADETPKNTAKEAVNTPETGQNGPEAPRDSRVANAATYVDRATRGVEQLPEAEHKGWAESKSQAAERIAQDPDYARNLAAEVAKKPRAIDDVETMALGAERKKLQDAYHQTHEDILKARESGNPIQEAQAHAKRADIESQLDLNERATKSAGTPLARALAARNALHAEDYTPARNITRAKVAFGDKFNKGIRKQVDALSERLQSAEATIARMEANKKAPGLKVERTEKKSKTRDEKKQAELKSKIDRLNDAVEKRRTACPI